MLEPGPARKLIITVNESDRRQGRSVYNTLLDLFRHRGLAGATVSRAIAGFTGRGAIRSVNVLDLSADLPVVVEVVEDEEHTAKLLSILDEMLTTSALVTLEKVRVVKYGVKN